MARTSVMRLTATGLCLVLLVAAGCSEPASPPGADASPTPAVTEPSPGASPEETPPEEEEIAYEVWFHRGERLTVVYRISPATSAVGRASVEALLAGPSGDDSGAGMGTQVPEGTRLNGLAVADGVATVDLSEDFASGGGSLSMSMRVAQVVYTLTQFSTVDEVRFRLDGEDVDGIGGEGVSTEDPLSRADFSDLAPAIVVDSPMPGARVSSGVRVSGNADVFEATVSFRVLDEAGNVLREAFTTATCGTGCRGDYRKGLRFQVDVEQPGTIEVYWASPEDGTDQDVVAIPVVLMP